MPKKPIRVSLPFGTLENEDTEVDSCQVIEGKIDPYDMKFLSVFYGK